MNLFCGPEGQAGSRHWIHLGLGALVLLFGSTFLARPIQDPDFFWHLKTGEWLWQHHSWPIPDPFAFTTPAVLDERQLFIVKGYWLSQLIYLTFYALCNWWGIFFLRIALFLALLWVFWMNRREDLWLWCSASLACLTVLFSWYPVERPQYFSFLCFVWLYLLLDRFWAGSQVPSRRDCWVVGGVMLLWGNLHGGVLLGHLLLLVTLLASRAPFSRRGGIAAPGLWKLAVVGLVAGCCNPNLTRLVPVFLEAGHTSSLLYAVNDEFASFFKVWQGPQRPLAITYLVVLALSLPAAAVSLRRQLLPGLLIWAGTAVYAGLHIRYLPFFIMAAVPVAVRGFSAIGWRGLIRGVAVSGALALVIVLVWNDRRNFSLVRSSGWVSEQHYPVGVADWIASSSLDGRMFNLYRWGGYLLWRLGPERQVFVDGRALDDRVIRESLTAELVSFKGRLLWKEIFDKYQVSYAVLPRFENGVPFQLTFAVASDPGWEEIVSSGNAVLLARKP